MTLKIEVGRKGYVIIPKVVRDLVGIKEGDKLIVKVENGKIILEPEIKVNIEEFRGRLENHWRTINKYARKRPKLGDLAGISLEEEFEEHVH